MSEDVKHTAGPWSERWDYRRVSLSTKTVAAHALGPQHSCVGVKVCEDSEILQPDRATMEKVFADARLIAAAPDLLQALQMMVEEKADYMRINNLGDPETQHTIKIARAAISRADSPSPMREGPVSSTEREPSANENSSDK
jgi:hypothetical protein